jgi:hypothetical protein
MELSVQRNPATTARLLALSLLAVLAAVVAAVILKRWGIQ